MKRKLWGGAVMAGGLVLLLSGCSTEKKVEFDDAAAAREAMDHAVVITMEANLVNASQSSNICADGKVAGFMKEEGFWDTKWNVSVGDELWFYMKYVADEPINDVEGVLSATTMGFYDSGDTCLGYAQERHSRTADGGYSDYYMVFLDGDGNETGYYAETDGSALYDADANVIATGTSSMRFFSDNCDFSIEMQEDCDAQLDFMYKLAMYKGLFDEVNDRYLNR